MSTFLHRTDLSRIEREIQKVGDLPTARALRALLDAVRQNAARLDVIEARSSEPATKPSPPPDAGEETADRA